MRPAAFEVCAVAQAERNNGNLFPPYHASDNRCQSRAACPSLETGQQLY
ncbi:hypothetical protein ABEX25_28580 [Paenibacillus thiaminolyticus]